MKSEIAFNLEMIWLMGFVNFALLVFNEVLSMVVISTSKRLVRFI
jgi:hypothetical protein